MSNVTQILDAIAIGDKQAVTELFPLVYDELRKMAAHQMLHEKPGQTLQPTALVHEVFLRLVGSSPETLANRQYFFAAAAEAMRRILIERARRMKLVRATITPDEIMQPGTLRLEVALSVHEALDDLQQEDPDAAKVVRLRYFAGLSMPEIAEILETPLRTVERWWMYARSWLYQRLRTRD